MGESVWKPHTTVASIGELDGRFLMVREVVDGTTVYNQPAGHLEPGETLLEAVVRETLEETRYCFKPQALQGIYRYRPAHESATTYLRFLFRGEVGERIDGELDPDIIAAEWLSYEQVLACQDQHRSPMVLQCIDDYLRTPGVSLDVLSQDFA
jgi:8-oxo-dGTP pyrophosphatase MutT (NUDIX family)